MCNRKNRRRKKLETKRRNGGKAEKLRIARGTVGGGEEKDGSEGK